MGTTRTKLAPPFVPRECVSRARLEERMSNVDRHRLTLVCAPAGYGKTTLLSQWFSSLRWRGANVGWLTLDASMQTAARIVDSIARMLPCAPCSGQKLRSLPAARSNADALLASLIERWAAVDAPLFLFLDDVHSVGAESAAMLGELLRCAPTNTHFVLAAREVTRLELSAMRAYGQLFEIGAGGLRFTRDEAAAFLDAEGLRPAEGTEIEALVARTEGWVTGLKLASAAARGERGGAACLSAISGRRSAVADFFAENIYGRQDEQVRRFLLDTAAIDGLTAEICDAVTGRSDSALMLRHLHETGSFVFAQDDERKSYRYHVLFAEFLQRKLDELDPHAGDRLHRRAAEWLAAQGRFAEALEHALRSRDSELLAAMLETVAEDFTYSGKVTLIAEYAAQLPQRVLARSPWTLLAVAWLKIRKLRNFEAGRMLEMASSHLERVRASCGGDEIDALQRTLEHRRMMLAAARDDMEDVEQRCEELLLSFGQTQPFITCTLNTQLLMSRREQFRFDGLERLHAQSRAIADESGFRFALVALQAAAGVSLFAAGKTEAAISALSFGLDESVRWAGRDSGLAALVALPLADIAYEANDLAQAADYTDRYLPLARELSFVDQLVAGYIVRSRLCLARGDLPAAEQLLREAIDLALQCDLERLRLAALQEQVRILLQNGLPEAAARTAAQTNQLGRANAHMPHARTNTKDELRALIWTRLAISQDRIGDALAVTRQWRAFCAQRGAQRSFVRWNILMAQLLMVEGDARSAQRAMREAITAAAPAKLVRSFVDEGSAVLTILSDAYVDAPPSLHPADLFAKRVLDAFESKRLSRMPFEPMDDGLCGRLSGRELEILTLVACGMRNREIGSRLGLSEGSVKWYMQQVYDKVGTRRRSQAVDRARQFGLIA